MTPTTEAASPGVLRIIGSTSAILTQPFATLSYGDPSSHPVPVFTIAAPPLPIPIHLQRAAALSQPNKMTRVVVGFGIGAAKTDVVFTNAEMFMTTDRSIPLPAALEARPFPSTFTTAPSSSSLPPVGNTATAGGGTRRDGLSPRGVRERVAGSAVFRHWSRGGRRLRVCQGTQGHPSTVDARPADFGGGGSHATVRISTHNGTGKRPPLAADVFSMPAAALARAAAHAGWGSLSVKTAPIRAVLPPPT